MILCAGWITVFAINIAAGSLGSFQVVVGAIVSVLCALMIILLLSGRNPSWTRTRQRHRTATPRANADDPN